MKNFIFWVIDAIIRIFLINSSRVSVGKGSQVAWWHLGRKRGRLDIGQDCIVQCRVDFDSPSGHVSIGDRSYVGASHLVCHSRIEIAEDVIISWDVTIIDHNSHSLDWRKRTQDVARWMRDERTAGLVGRALVLDGIQGEWLGSLSARFTGLQYWF